MRFKILTTESYFIKFLVSLTVTVILTQTAKGKIYPSFNSIIEPILPCVVNIRSDSLEKNKSNHELYHKFFDGNPPKTASRTSLGTGLIIDKKGHIITNYHIVAASSRLKVKMHSVPEDTAVKILGTDQKTNLAVLKSSKTPEKCRPSFANSKKTKLGDLVVAIGFPFGHGHVVTEGILSATGPVIGQKTFDHYYRTSARIDHSNSGGPLMDVRGRVIGLNMFHDNAMKHNFVIPNEIFLQIAKELIKSGHIVRPWMGIVGKNIVSSDDSSYQAEQPGIYGIIVSNLLINSPAHKSNLKIGDIIMEVNTTRIDNLDTLAQMLKKFGPNSMVSLKVYRRVKGMFSTQLTLEQRPKQLNLPDQEQLF